MVIPKAWVYVNELGAVNVGNVSAANITQLCINKKRNLLLLPKRIYLAKRFLSSLTMPMIIVFSAGLFCGLGFYDHNVGRVVLSY